ncbi:MAG: hypothetical protein ACFE95_11705 [Candidatus Hodarchaeota archaeon]
MSFPCSHCGGEESFADRKTDDFKPIIPIELQGDFEKPPEFISDPSYTPTPLSTESNTKPVSKTPVPKESSGVSSTPTIIPPSKSNVDPGILEGPPNSPPMTEAHSISRVVEGMVTKTEETSYRTFVKHRLLEIETTIQNIQTDIRALIKSQKHIENMLKEMREQE